MYFKFFFSFISKYFIFCQQILFYSLLFFRKKCCCCCRFLLLGCADMCMCGENFLKALMTRIRKNYDLCFMKWKSHHILIYWNQYKPNSIELIFKWYLISIDRYFIVWNVKIETDSENWVANITRNAFDYWPFLFSVIVILTCSAD